MLGQFVKFNAAVSITSNKCVASNLYGIVDVDKDGLIVCILCRTLRINMGAQMHSCPLPTICTFCQRERHLHVSTGTQHPLVFGHISRTNTPIGRYFCSAMIENVLKHICGDSSNVELIWQQFVLKTY